MGRRLGPQRFVYLGQELDDAVQAHLESSGQSLSELVRAAVATAIGRPDLAETVRMGRPKKGDDVKTNAPEPLPVKKKAAVRTSVTRKRK